MLCRTVTPKIFVECSISADKTTGTVTPQTTWFLEDTRSSAVIASATDFYMITTQLVTWDGESDTITSGITSVSQSLLSSKVRLNLYNSLTLSDFL